MAVDLKFPSRTTRILAVYLHNILNYGLSYFQIIFDDIERLSMEVMNKGYALVIVDDFNLFLARRDRRKNIAEFENKFSMDIANASIAQVYIHSWKLKSSISGLHRLDYILHIKNL